MPDPVSTEPRRTMSLLLTGDVMTGRGIDQILQHPGDPIIYEGHATSALDYVDLAERVHGPIPRPNPFDYVWGDALAVLDERRPEVTLINLETAITARGAPESKGINYRMHPGNTGVLVAGRINACTLANNHVLDWGTAGLEDTLDALSRARIGMAGAGRSLHDASAPLVIPVPGKGRVIIFAYGCKSSGIPTHWRALPDRPGINLLANLSPAAVGSVADMTRDLKQPGDIVIASLHWGGNWGYDIPDEQRDFAHALIDEAMIDIVHGHSSHHPKAVEVYHGKLILYGCGDLINDYEGIGGYRQYRGDLVLMYFARISTDDGTLRNLDMVPFRICRFRLRRLDHHEANWLATNLSHEGAPLGTRVEVAHDHTLKLHWA